MNIYISTVVSKLMVPMLMGTGNATFIMAEKKSTTSSGSCSGHMLGIMGIFLRTETLRQATPS